MGCTYDIFSGRIKQSEYVQDFIDIWNSVLEDELYDDYATIDMDSFQIDDDGISIFNIQSEPLFCTMECGTQIEKFLIEFFKKHPDAELSCEYECTYNNCGDMNIKIFNTENGVIHVRALNSEAPFVNECPHCGYEPEDEDELSMRLWDPDKPFICPECGKEIELDVFVDDYDIDVASGKYSFNDELYSDDDDDFIPNGY